MFGGMKELSQAEIARAQAIIDARSSCPGNNCACRQAIPWWVQGPQQTQADAARLQGLISEKLRKAPTEQTWPNL